MFSARLKFFLIVQPVPGQPWRRVAGHCVQCSSSSATSARSTLEKGGQLLGLMHTFC